MDRACGTLRLAWPSAESFQHRQRVVSLLLVLGAWASVLTLRPVYAIAAEPAVTVTMTNEMQFVPARVTVHVGETVVWRNTSMLVHTVTADPAMAVKQQDVVLPAGAAPFNSGFLPPQGAFHHRFKIPGLYRYFCIPHEPTGMVGTVVVKPTE